MSLQDLKNIQLPQDYRGAVDIPDLNDFSAVHILGAAPIVLKDKVDLNVVPSHNQGGTWECTAYGLTHIEEIMNTLEHNTTVKLDTEEQWGNQCAARKVSLDVKGDSLQNGLSTLSKNGLTNKNNPEIKVDKFTITGYAVVDHDVNEFKARLSQGFPIYTGWQVHCFALVGYDDNKKEFLAKNSYAAPNDKFTVRYDEIGQLFTSYILYDKKDPIMSMIFKDVSVESPLADEIKWNLDHGIMEGYGNDADPQNRFFRPTQNITRAEQAAVNKRMYNMIMSQVQELLAQK